MNQYLVRIGPIAKRHGSNTHWLKFRRTFLFIFASARLRRWCLKRRPPRQVLGHQVNEHGSKDQNQAEPKSPIVVRKSPVRAVAMLSFAPIRIRLMPRVLYFIHV
jgi:hypothetical protein